MAVSQKQIMERAFRIANGAGVDPHSSPVIDNAFLLEDLFPAALREAVKNNPESNKRAYSLTLSAGEAILPDTVVEEWLDDSTAYLSTDANLLASYEKEYIDFVRAGLSYPQLAYYTVRGNKFCYRGAGQSIGTATGTVNLVAVGIPDIPDTITDDMTISTELMESTIVRLAQMIRGAKPE